MVAAVTALLFSPLTALPKERVALIATSDSAERCWLLVHAAQGPHLIGVWYRPPIPGESATIETFKTELQGLADQALVCIGIGDINIHHRQWLQHSSHDSAEGKR